MSLVTIKSLSKGSLSQFLTNLSKVLNGILQSQVMWQK